MSAFVVSTETMDRVVDGVILAARLAGKHGQAMDSFAGIRTTDPDARTMIGRKLFAMNHMAVNYRYGSLARDTWPLDEHQTYTYGTGGKGQSPAALVKAMDCLAYQCAEGDVPKSRLYKELATAIGLLCRDIVSGLPNYERAPWD